MKRNKYINLIYKDYSVTSILDPGGIRDRTNELIIFNDRLFRYAYDFDLVPHYKEEE